jgi:hypothetical protein
MQASVQQEQGTAIRQLSTNNKCRWRRKHVACLAMSVTHEAGARTISVCQNKMKPLVKDTMKQCMGVAGHSATSLDLFGSFIENGCSGITDPEQCSHRLSVFRCSFHC